MTEGAPPSAGRGGLAISTLVAIAGLALGLSWALRSGADGEEGKRQAVELPPPAVSRAPPPSPSAPEPGRAPAAEADLRVTSPEELRRVVHAARAAGEDEAPALRRLALESPDPLVAGNALRALGRLQRVAGDGELSRLLHDPRLRVRQEMVVALGKSGDPAAVPELLALLGSRGEPGAAAGATGATGATPAISATPGAAVTAAAGAAPSLRPLVIQALGRLGGPEARAALERVLDDPAARESERAFARAGLGAKG